MPTIAVPPRAHALEREVVAPAGHAPRGLGTLWLQARVAVRRRSLTRRLAEGADPAASPALALRARQLTGERSRRWLGRSLRRAVWVASHPAPGRPAVGLIRRGAVLDAERAIDLLVKRLRSPVPVTAEGVAMVERMLSDGAWSPMYRAAGPGTLRWMVVVATAALEPSAV